MPIERRVRQKFYQTYKNCKYCNVEVSLDVPESHPQRATIDHVVAKCFGGSNVQKNLVISCFKCNNEKANYERILREAGVKNVSP